MCAKKSIDDLISDLPPADQRAGPSGIAWYERLRDGLCAMDASSMASLMRYIAVVEGHGAKLMMRQEGGHGVAHVTWRDGRLVIMREEQRASDGEAPCQD